MNQSSAQLSMPELERFFDLASDLMCILDAEGRCLQVNSAFEQTLGYRVAELSDRSLTTLAHPDDQSQNQAQINQILSESSSDPPLRFTNRYLAKNGQLHWFAWTISAVSPRADSKANSAIAKQLYCVARDISEREAAEERYLDLLRVERDVSRRVDILEAEAQLYVSVIHNMQVGLYLWRLENPADPNSLRLVAANPVTEEFTGVSIQTITNKLILEAFPALAETDIPARYAEVCRTGKNQDLDEVTYGDDRVAKSVFTVKAFPLPDRCVGIVFDNVTLHKQAEALRQEQDAQLRVMFEQANVGMARLSPEGQWMQVNQHLCQMLGYEAEELLQKTFVEITYAQDREQDSQHYQAMLKGDRTRAEMEKRFVTKRGDIVWTLTNASTICNSEGKLLYFIADIQNITKQKEAAIALKSQKDSLLTTNMMLTHTMRTLEQRNEELDQFAYVTSHDLKAPLRAIANLATWIEEDLDGKLPPENAEQFDLLKNRVHRMEGLINGLLEYSRIGRTHQSSEQVNVADLLEEIIDSLPVGDFKMQVVSEMPTFQAKLTPLSQVFSNLINNAIKHHNREDGQVKISCQDLGAFYEFSVQDDGPGIAENYHEKIFTIFQTLRARDELESTGIGLSLVKKTVLAEGGAIQLFSQPDRGATFKFTWPKMPHIADSHG